MKPSGMGKIRGSQIAAYIGGKTNPRHGYMDDVCIYVKAKPSLPIPKRTYLDVGDQILYSGFMKERRECSLIAISKSQKAVLETFFKDRNIVLIPENHCNYERRVNKRTKPKVAGVIGGWNSFKYSHEHFAWMLKSIGLQWKFQPHFASRKDVVNFYRGIDIQVVYRPKTHMAELCNPLKLANAGSFGIPTIAFPEPSYLSDFGEAFIEAPTIDDILSELKRMVEDEQYYTGWKKQALEKAEEFHIEHISQLYLALDEESR